MKKPLSDFRIEYFEASAKASEINRSLSLAVVAIVWTFVGTNKDKIIIQGWLKWALIWTIASLLLDLIQYIFRTISIALFYRKKEKKIDAITDKTKRKKKSEDINDYPDCYTYINWFFWYIKILFTIISYCCLFVYISKILK